MIIGVDIDGVLADFNGSFIERVIQVTGEDKFPPRPFDIPLWNYPEHYGYTAEENSAVWENIKSDRTFWRTLEPYPDARAALAYLDEVTRHDDLYFVTARPGVAAKIQTEYWLTTHGYEYPTVLIASDKASIAQALKFDVYIDDRWENCEAVRTRSRAKVFLMSRPWNYDAPNQEYGIVRTNSVIGIAERPYVTQAA